MTTVLDSALTQWRRPVMRGKAEFSATCAADSRVTVAAGSTATAPVGSARRECHHQVVPAVTSRAAATRPNMRQDWGQRGADSVAGAAACWRRVAAGTAGVTSCSRVATDGAIEGESRSGPVSCVQSAREVLWPVRSLLEALFGTLLKMFGTLLETALERSTGGTGTLGGRVLAGGDTRGGAGGSARMASTVNSANRLSSRMSPSVKAYASFSKASMRPPTPSGVCMGTATTERMPSWRQASRSTRVSVSESSQRTTVPVK